jgi:beta-lactam-binding protein with PASTA domain
VQVSGTVAKQNPESGNKVRIGDVIDLWVVPAGIESNAPNEDNTQP